MKRMILTALWLLLSTHVASADYLLVKINVNQLNFVPSSLPNPGMTGGTTGVAPPTGHAWPQPNVMDDPNARWVSAYIEVKGDNKQYPGKPASFALKGQPGKIWQVDHKWGSSTWVPESPHFPMIGSYITADPLTKQFSTKFNHERQEKASAAKFIMLARWALARGLMTQFHQAMKEAEKFNPKPAEWREYQKVKDALSSELKDTDPAQADELSKLRQVHHYTPSYPGKHFCIYAKGQDRDPVLQATIRRRAALMEQTLETFYYWFALQGNACPQPAMLKYCLVTVISDKKEDFLTRYEQWGSLR